MIDWNRIIKETDEHGYMSGVDRQSERVKATGEVFTPTELVVEILQEMLKNDPDTFAPGETVIDPACGDGQFLVPVKLLKMYHYGMTEADALADIYGVDIMRDNVDLCRSRLGGGTIVMGDTLNPAKRLPEQTEAEHATMMRLFAPANLMAFMKK
jgi:N-6 DNA Methylase